MLRNAKTVCWALGLVVLSWAATARAQDVLFVDFSASGDNDGSSWENAFTDLQDALATARNQPDVNEIRVARGVYSPAPPSGDHTISFDLVDDVALKGGYAGGGAADPDARNSVAYLTVLTGDLNDDDDSVGTADNSFHVVTAAFFVSSSALLDGFTITAGRAVVGTGDEILGGGLFNDGGAPTIISCIFIDNQAQRGGGMHNKSGTPRLVNCLFNANSASFGGGGLLTEDATATLTNCTFVNNDATFFGGGIFNDGSNADTQITNCILWNNSDFVGMNEAAQIDIRNGGSPSINHTCIEGLTGLLGGMNNIGDDPDFIDQALANFRLNTDSPCIDTGNNAPPGDLTPADLDGSIRIVNITVDMGAYERAGDCNENDVPDNIDLIMGDSVDCGGNGLPDECDIDRNSTAPGGPFFCDANCDPDCNNNGIPDACEPDCNNNDIPDECDITDETSEDCNDDGIPDECSGDCNINQVPDVCDIFGGTSDDCNANGLPDECEIDVASKAPGGPFFCIENCDPDCNGNGLPDECELNNNDCNDNGVPDECDISGDSEDCNSNRTPDECEIDENTPGGPFFCTVNCDPDCNDNGIPDDCEPDCQGEQGNGVPDDCDIDPNDPDGDGRVSPDCDSNNQPDECQPDADQDGVIDACDDCLDTPPDVPVRPDGCDQVGACCFPTLCLDGQGAAACLGFLDASFLGDLLACDGDPDGDQAIGCDDGCPLDPDKTEPGFCGCGVPDDMVPGSPGDCNVNGTPDICDINSGESRDCNQNEIPDECDIDPSDPDGDGRVSADCDLNNQPDECQIPVESKSPGGPFFCTEDCQDDCNGNGFLDVCDIADETSQDCDSNGIPDECEEDTDDDGLIDACDPCIGENALIEQPCDNPEDPDPCRAGIYDCSSGTLECTDDVAADDEDGDGVFDCQDRCLGTAPETQVDPAGCRLTGACCNSAGGCLSDTSEAFCNAIDGFYQGNGSACGTCHFPGDGDCDGDGDVDIDDHELFMGCLETVGDGPVTVECECADLTGDGLLNLRDWAKLQVLITDCVHDCPKCPRGTDAPGGDCCDINGNGTPGCDIAGEDVEFPFLCCEAVCQEASICCLPGFQWVPLCANLARTLFPGLCNCPELPVACCFPNGDCFDLLADTCVNGGGFPQEPLSSCADADACQAECPPDAAGDCCDPIGNGTSGCEIPACCDAVCAQNPECCFATWDSSCALAAGNFPECGCPVVACCLSDGSCLVLTVENCELAGGFPQAPGLTCLGNNNADPRDDACEFGCPVDAAGDCCDAAGTGSAGCGNPECCDAVCVLDIGCCLDVWEEDCAVLAAQAATECQCPVAGCCLDDGSCQDETAAVCINTLAGEPRDGFLCVGDLDLDGTDDLCEVCGPASGDCCDDLNDTPGCNDVSCCDIVCGLDPFCCEVFWGEDCVTIAQDSCGGLCDP